MGPDDLGAPARVLERSGADVDAAAAGGQGALETRVITDAARQLDVDVELTDDVGEQLGVRAAAEGRIEVHQVQPARAGLHPALGGLVRVAEDLSGAGHPLDQLDRLSVLDVDGGKELQGLAVFSAHG